MSKKEACYDKKRYCNIIKGLSSLVRNSFFLYLCAVFRFYINNNIFYGFYFSPYRYYKFDSWYWYFFGGMYDDVIQFGVGE